jgi:hypothetical protein
MTHYATNAHAAISLRLRHSRDSDVREDEAEVAPRKARHMPIPKDRLDDCTPLRERMFASYFPAQNAFGRTVASAEKPNPAGRSDG